MPNQRNKVTATKGANNRRSLRQTTSSSADGSPPSAVMEQLAQVQLALEKLNKARDDEKEHEELWRDKVSQLKGELDSSLQEKKALQARLDQQIADAATSTEQLGEVQRSLKESKQEQQYDAVRFTELRTKLKSVLEEKKALQAQQEGTGSDVAAIAAASSPFSSSPKFNCQTSLPNIKIVKELGRGKRKVIFEVVLPNGEHAVAKRCIDPSGSDDRCSEDLMKEARLFEHLHSQYGDHAIIFHGDCQFTYYTKKEMKQVLKDRGITLEDAAYNDWIIERSRDFTRGHTVFLELGVPLKTTWDEDEGEAKMEFSDQDIEDFRTIARQYDNFNGGRLKLGKDLKYVQQYARVKAGIRNVDLDMLQIQAPPAPSVLYFNCHMLLSDLVGLKIKYDKRYNCTEAYSQEHGWLSSKGITAGEPPAAFDLIGDGGKDATTTKDFKKDKHKNTVVKEKTASRKAKDGKKDGKKEKATAKESTEHKKAKIAKAGKALKERESHLD